MRLGDSFEDDLREALLEDAEHELVGKQDSLLHRFVQAAHGRLEEYAAENDYRLQSVLDSLSGPEVERGRSFVRVRIGWAHEAAEYFQRGTSDHTVEGNPWLSFVWEKRHDPPDWVKDVFDREGRGWRVFFREVEVSGIPASRFVRDALERFRSEVRR